MRIHRLGLLVLGLAFALPARADKLFHERSGAAPQAALPSLAPLVKDIRPAVVNIASTQKMRQRYMDGEDPFQQFFGGFFGGQGVPRQRELERQSLGSGFIISEKGYVLTNNHVIEGADHIKIHMADGREFNGRVVGTDPKTDVALVKIDSPDTNFPFAYLGDSDTLQIGDWVLAIGNPFGFELSVTHGLVSAKERSIGAGPYDDFIQSDALINPGNSGGPLFNLAGEVVGINTAITSKGQGIGFAVPINMAKQLLPQLQTGHIVRGWLGIGLQPLTPDLARSLKLPGTKGALVSQVQRGQPAQKAGLKSGDVVVAFNGHPIESAAELTRDVAAVAPGTKVPMDFLRDGQQKSLKVKLGQRPEEGEEVAEAGGDEGEGAPEGQAKPDSLGMAVRPLNPEQAQAMGLNAGEGVVVVDVRADSAAAQAGVERGDVVLEVNKNPVHSIREYEQAIRSVHAGDMALLRLQRQQASLYIAVRV